MGRDPLGSKKRVTYTAKRSIVIQTDRYAFKSRNGLLTRMFCSNRLLFGDDGDGDDGGRCGVVELFTFCSPHVTTHSMSTRVRAHAHYIVPRTDRTDVTI